MESNIEFLIVIQNIEKYFDKDSIHEFMSKNMGLKIERNYLIYEKNEFEFSIRLFKHVDKCQRFELHLVIPTDASENTVLSLIEIVTLRLSCINKDTDVRLIWNSYSLRYNIEAYSIINTLENLATYMFDRYGPLN